MVKILQGTLDFNGRGYVYKVKADGFKKIDGWQYVSFQENVPEEVIEIKVKDYWDRVVFSAEAKQATIALHGYSGFDESIEWANHIVREQRLAACLNSNDREVLAFHKRRIWLQ